MNHEDHVALLRDGVTGQVWADIGSGEGAFTLALAELLGTGTIYSIDRDANALRHQAEAMSHYPHIVLHTQRADFTHPLNLPPLDGIVMANALHFVERKHQLDVLRQLRTHLKPDGIFILVEYDADMGNSWVPYPVAFATWEKLAPQCGFKAVRFLGSRPSRFLNAIYSAIAR
jgi:ubiquinone/menaquinone biosynthesis C-methylase UbiE